MGDWTDKDSEAMDKYMSGDSPMQGTGKEKCSTCGEPAEPVTRATYCSSSFHIDLDKYHVENGKLTLWKDVAICAGKTLKTAQEQFGVIHEIAKNTPSRSPAEKLHDALVDVYAYSEAGVDICYDALSAFRK